MDPNKGFSSLLLAIILIILIIASSAVGYLFFQGRKIGKHPSSNSANPNVSQKLASEKSPKTSADKQVDAVWNTFVFPKYSFTMKLPSDWYLSNDLNDPIIIFPAGEITKVEDNLNLLNFYQFEDPKKLFSFDMKQTVQNGVTRYDQTAHNPEIDQIIATFKFLDSKEVESLVNKSADAYLPPGCIQRDLKPGELPPLGGCFGKNRTKNLSVSPLPPACLKVRSNDCVGAALEIENLCPKGTTVTIQGEKLTEPYTNLVFGKDASGKLVNLTRGEAPSPIKDEDIKINMTINNDKYAISYTRTKDYCE